MSLVDFALAASASGGTSVPLSLHSLYGTLAYMSPEQTGRMNRIADDRSDFYSLGVLARDNAALNVETGGTLEHLSGMTNGVSPQHERELLLCPACGGANAPAESKP